MRPQPGTSPRPSTSFPNIPSASYQLSIYCLSPSVWSCFNPATRRSARERRDSFFNDELAAKSRAALLDAARTDAELTVRAWAWESLADATGDAAIANEMIALLNDASKSVEERGGAAVGLYGVADRDDARAGIEALYQSGGQARVKALEAMWRSLWKPYAKYFPAHLDDRDPATVREALRGAGYFELTRYVDKIASYFDRDEPFHRLREDALFAFAMAMPGETTPWTRSRDAAKNRLHHAADAI